MTESCFPKILYSRPSARRLLPKMAASGTVYNPAKIGTVGEDKINAWRDEPHLEMDLLKVRHHHRKTPEYVSFAHQKRSLLRLFSLQLRCLCF